MPSQFLQVKRAGYNAMRAASQGAGISLLCCSGEYQADFECATKAAAIIGSRNLDNITFGEETIPRIAIPFAEMSKALGKLCERFSVALLDTHNEHNATKFVMIVKLPQNGAAVQTADQDGDELPDSLLGGEPETKIKLVSPEDEDAELPDDLL